MNLKQESTGGRVVENLRAHGGHGERLRDASLDRSRADRANARRHCPQAALVFEKVPVIQLANDAVDRIPPARGEGPAVGGRTVEKPFSRAEESGRSHRVPGGTARGGGPTQFQHNQDRPDASGPREHRLQGRLPAGAPVAEGAGAPCPFSRRQGPLPGFYGQALFPPSLALRRYPHPLRMPTDQRLCRGAHERPLCYRGKSFGVPLPPQPPHHAPLHGTSTPAATPRSIPQKPSRNPLFCPLPIPQKEQRGNLTAKGGPER